MADVVDYSIFKNNRFEVLTQDGFKDFKGVIKGKNYNKLIIHTYKNSLICTPKHKLMVDDNKYTFAKDLKIGDTIYNGIVIIDIIKVNNTKPVYEFLEIKDNHTYYANGFLSKQCLLIDEQAFIEPNIMKEFWSAVYPTISSSDNAKVLIASTPNGVGNLFHKLWEVSKEKGSGWGRLEVPWSNVPGKTKEWADQERMTLGDEQFQQEYECKFLESGGSNISQELYNELQKSCRKPRIEHDDGAYKIFEQPNIKDRMYCAGVDIGEGVGKCASTVCVFDITELTRIEQVATYHCTDIGPYEFARRVNEVMTHWGKPPLAVERNNTGGGIVINTLDKEYNYPNLVNFATKQGNRDYSHLKGVTSSTNTKYHGVENMFYLLKDHRRVVLHDEDYLKELNTFVSKGSGKWGKKSDSYFDDRVDAMMWALVCVHEMVVNQYFNVVRWDDNKKPILIQAMYEAFGRKDMNYLFGSEENNYGIDSVFMGDGGWGDDSEMDNIIDAGWLTPTQDADSGWASYHPAPNYS